MPLKHETIDAMESRRSATHLGELLVKHGVLSQRNRVVVGFQGWLDRKLPGYSPETARLLTAFTTWQHLRRMRAAADTDRLVAGAAASVKLQISVAGQLLTHLENQNIGFTQVSQADVDAWLVAGPSTRYLVRNFVIWAVIARHLPAVTIPDRTPRTSPILRQDERLSPLRRVLHGEDLPLELRVAATLLLLSPSPALRQLVLDIPPAVVAQALGYSPQVAENHARPAGTNWVAYASH